MTKQQSQINLLNQIIEKAQEEDAEFKLRMIQQHKGQQALGEGWMLFHLKALRELLLKDNKE